MIQFKFTEKDTEYYRKWFKFYPKRNKGTGFEFVFEKWGYFDPRPQINTNLTSLLALILPFFSLWLLPLSVFLCFYSWGEIYLKLPYNTKKTECSDENTSFGVMFYHVDSGFPTELWIRGWKSFNFPWAFTFDKREIFMKTGNWKKEEKGDDMWDKQKWGGLIYYETHPYTYTLKSGEIQERTATCYVEKRYWKRYWFPFKKAIKYLEIEFSGEVGERSGSWKGGCIGCSYRMNKGETIRECLRRMENERKF